MSDIFASPFFGITISILAFFIGLEIQKRTRIALCNPLLLAIILVIVFLKIFGIPYDDYNEGGAIINVSSINATVNLAVVGQLLLVGIGLTLVAALVAVIFVLRYEPLQILADRS